MTKQTRNEIEISIRELADQRVKDIIVQQHQGIIPGKTNMSLVEAMLDKWGELADYYEQSVYHSENDTDVDLEMSIHIVRNYLDSLEHLRIQLKGAVENNDEILIENINDYIDLLEHAMERIFEAVYTIDPYWH